ncbi:TIGR03618 family F420-dependent PPOX class oxidoreductase [Streptomyces sp. VRA16 Mangrove soil]|uniref:TIGR03618 family F420-dependent PPOX class oxidoreductase n=1 Tax=Streptomyces sp. VRA16 Mangrove soil TaxID=2817434 RepID=UPI001A9E92DC|nr:TIGR03618 family F420-dependent PPOX class oxidoreductase [Streptomyces sp. VRA16 Mangrove soil]MBO1337482.1 TIGR03618 family F420-dependent PPOX class oxidoreductase [Streptomyces sp. VRA16 Mangrove soil]
MSGPAPRVLTDPELQQILEEGKFGILASVRRSGHPHLSTVLYRWDSAERVLRVSTTADRLKPRHFRADPHAALHVRRDDFAYAVVEGEAEVSAPTVEPGDAVGLELLAMAREFVPAGGEEAFLAEVVEERRVVLRIKAARLYGTALDVG